MVLKQFRIAVIDILMRVMLLRILIGPIAGKFPDLTVCYALFHCLVTPKNSSRAVSHPLYVCTSASVQSTKRPIPQSRFMGVSG